jgi:hypothetical protein
MVKRRIPPALTARGFVLGAVWVLLGFLASAYSDEGRRFRIQSEEDLTIARKSVLRELAPLLPDVLREAGMRDDQASALCERFQNVTIVCGGNAQMEHDYARANEILAALPEKARRKFLRLSYQWTGPSSLWRDEVASALSLEPDQQRQIGEILVDFIERLAPANRPDFSYEMTAEQDAAYGRRTAEIEAERDRRLLEVLSPAQRKAWQELIGPKSKALQDFRDYCAKYNPH